MEPTVRAIVHTVLSVYTARPGGVPSVKRPFPGTRFVTTPGVGSNVTVPNYPLDLAPTATFTLPSTTEVRALRERLRIGEIARLVGVTTKTVRHYEKVGLLGEPERSGSGYRPVPRRGTDPNHPPRSGRAAEACLGTARTHRRWITLEAACAGLNGAVPPARARSLNRRSILLKRGYLQNLLR
jgi:hypothetical protein